MVRLNTTVNNYHATILSRCACSLSRVRALVHFCCRRGRPTSPKTNTAKNLRAAPFLRQLIKLHTSVRGDLPLSGVYAREVKSTFSQLPQRLLGMSLNGYVGNAADAARIRRLTEQREKEKADFEARPQPCSVSSTLRGQRSRAALSPDACAPAAETQALKAGSSSRGNGTRLVGFASSNVEYVEHVFKQDTVGLQTKEQFAEKARLHGWCTQCALVRVLTRCVHGSARTWSARLRRSASVRRARRRRRSSRR